MSIVACWNAESFALQMVVVSEPRLVAELLHSSDLAKPTQPVMVNFRQVTKFDPVKPIYTLPPSRCLPKPCVCSNMLACVLE